MHWVFWAMAGAAVAHFAEEYLFGWSVFNRGAAGRRAAGFTGKLDLTAFVAVNAVLVALCVAGALVGLDKPFFSLSIAALFLINTVAHLVPMAMVRRYSPGSASAVFLYVPLAVYAFHVADEAGELGFLTVAGAFLLGLLWLSFPIGVSFILSARRQD